MLNAECKVIRLCFVRDNHVIARANGPWQSPGTIYILAQQAVGFTGRSPRRLRWRLLAMTYCYFYSVKNLRCNLAQNLPQTAHRQAHHIIIVAYHALAEQGRAALDAVRTGLVHRLAALYIPVDFPVA